MIHRIPVIQRPTIPETRNERVGPSMDDSSSSVAVVVVCTSFVAFKDCYTIHFIHHLLHFGKVKAVIFDEK